MAHGNNNNGSLANSMKELELNKEEEMAAAAAKDVSKGAIPKQRSAAAVKKTSVKTLQEEEEAK